MNPTLSATEHSYLGILEERLRKKFRTLCHVCEELERIRQQQLYKDHGTFEDYCLNAWGLNPYEYGELLKVYHLDQD